MTNAPLPQTGTHLPDPGFFYYTRCHQQVLDKITYAIESRMGFTLLTGEVGTGTPMGKLIFFNQTGVS
jgi:type II secretory pathway predicted ATPase ExeA